MASKDCVDWQVIDQRLAVGDSPEAKQQRDELFRGLDPNRSGSLSLSEVQSGLGKCLETSGNLRKTGQVAKGLIPGITDYKLPIKAAFKNARQLGTSSGGDSSTVDRTEFHALLVYFRHYLELLVLFKNLDTGGSEAGGDMTLSAKEITPNIDKLEKWDITLAQVKSKLNMEPSGEISFEHFADWCLHGKLKELSFDPTEGVKELKGPADSTAPSEVVAAQPMSPQESSKSFPKARSSQEHHAIRMRAVERMDERIEKMRAVEREYREKLNQIALQESTLKLPDNKLPSFHARVQSNTEGRIKKAAASDAEYKTWVQQRKVSHEERVSKLVSERAASIVDMRAKAQAQRQHERAIDVKAMGTFYHGVPNGKLPRPSRSKSATQLGFVPYTPEEMQERLEKIRNPIWEKSLKERADAAADYMKWSATLRANTKCAVDHIFTGKRAGQTNAQRDLIETAANEKRYWKWTVEMKSTKSCTIDQAWPRPNAPQRPSTAP